MENLDNTKLFELINEYRKDNGLENYMKVLNELKEGNAYLLLACDHDENTVGWRVTDKNFQIKLGIYIVEDGTQAITAFTTEEALFTYTKKVTKWVSLSSKEILNICVKNDIYRIVIDSALPTMFVVQRQKNK